ncbi:polysaccharide pyruvyl transferase family protein [Anatilimnocola floriformis]|uniref:polysaccharide pyruvyl transferase family protein n=1 Tax=Anatilimnocola floriformis TaxID=2948575 RepID=UPI0020C4A6EA|nr:polysaccharide pyruvyl transferase family protein [Anatilimnocola floriformis]
MIRMYWWQGGRGTGNFGDKLGPALVKAITGRIVTWAPIEKSDLLSIGSNLEPWLWPDRAWLDYRGVIWGAGRLTGVSPLQFPRANIVAARGELTLASLDVPARSTAATGDPALLCGHFYRPVSKPRYKLGIWPHWSEARNRELLEIAKSSSEIVMIDPCGEIQDTIDLVASCENIASSALHGLVVADALGIPSCWIRTPNCNREKLPQYKFLDYFSAFQSAPPRPRIIDAGDNLASLLPRMNDERLEDAARIQDDLLSAFPFRCHVAAF